MSSFQERRRRQDTVSSSKIARDKSPRKKRTVLASASNVNNCKNSKPQRQTISDTGRSIWNESLSPAPRSSTHGEPEMRTRTWRSVSDENSIIQMMHQISAEASNVMSDSTNCNNFEPQQHTRSDSNRSLFHNGSFSPTPSSTTDAETVSSSKVFRSAADEDSIIQMMHRLSTEVSNVTSDSYANKKNTIVNRARCATRDNIGDTTFPDKKNCQDERVYNIYSRTNSQHSKLAVAPEEQEDSESLNDHERGCDEIYSVPSDSSTQAVNANYTRPLSHSRLWHERSNEHGSVSDLFAAATFDHSNETELLYLTGDNTSTTLSEVTQGANTDLETQLARVKIQLEIEKKSHLQDIQRLDRQIIELVQKVDATVNEKVSRDEPADCKDEQINLLREQNGEHQRMVRELQRHSRESQEKDQQTMQHMQNQLELLSSRLDNRNDKVAQSRDETKEARAALQSATTIHLKEKKTLRVQLDAVEDELREKAHDTAKYEKALGESMIDIDRLVSKIEDMEAHLQQKEERMKESFKIVIKAVENFKQETFQNEDQITTLKQTIEGQKCEMLKERLMESEEKAWALSETCDKMQKKLDDESFLNQRRFEEILNKNEENYCLREKRLMQKMQERLDSQLSLKEKQFKDLEKELEKKYSVREDEITQEYCSRLKSISVNFYS